MVVKIDEAEMICGSIGIAMEYLLRRTRLSKTILTYVMPYPLSSDLCVVIRSNYEPHPRMLITAVSIFLKWYLMAVVNHDRR